MSYLINLIAQAKQLSLSQISAGTLGFAAGAAPAIEAGQNQFQEFASQAVQGIENPNNYLKGLIISGAIQIIMRLIDKWSEKRKAKKQVETQV